MKAPTLFKPQAPVGPALAGISSVTSPASSPLTLATFDTNQPIIVAPNGTGSLAVTGNNTTTEKGVVTIKQLGLGYGLVLWRANGGAADKPLRIVDVDGVTEIASIDRSGAFYGGPTGGFYTVRYNSASFYSSGEASTGWGGVTFNDKIISGWTNNNLSVQFADTGQTLLGTRTLKFGATAGATIGVSLDTAAGVFQITTPASGSGADTAAAFQVTATKYNRSFSLQNDGQLYAGNGILSPNGFTVNGGTGTGYIANRIWFALNNGSSADTGLDRVSAGVLKVSTGNGGGTGDLVVGNVNSAPYSPAFGVVSAKSANFSPSATADRGVLFSVTTGVSDITVTMPSAATAGIGYHFTVQKADTGTGRIFFSDATNSSLIVQKDYSTFISDGTNWLRSGTRYEDIRAETTWFGGGQYSKGYKWYSNGGSAALDTSGSGAGTGGWVFNWGGGGITPLSGDAAAGYTIGAAGRRVRGGYFGSDLATNTSGDSIVISNDAAATAANQRYSPRLRFSGYGWGTTAGTSQQCEFIQEMRPVQGTTPVPTLVWASQLAAGGYVDKMTLGSDGLLNLFATGTLRFGTTNGDVQLRKDSNQTLGVVLGDGASYANMRVNAVNYSGTLTGLSGGQILTNSAKTASYTLTSSDQFISFSGSTASQSLTLPAVSGTAGRIYQIKNRASVTVNVVTTAAANEIFTTVAANSVTLAVGDSAQFISDGTFWNKL